MLSFQQGFAQINSPYSRYGLGDWYNSRNVVNKAMGNLATPYIDYQAVNFINPASYSRLQAVSFDVGIESENRKIRDPKLLESYKSSNISFNYVALGLPLYKDKYGVTNWGMAFGLRPITKMNYKIQEESHLQGIDSVSTSYEGSGGLSQAFIGTGFRIKGLSVGVNLGFYFGQQDVSTRRTILNDSVFYFQAQYQSKVSYNKLFLNGGIQYDIKLNKKTNIRLGANGHLGSKLNASSDLFRQTVNYSNIGGFDTIDVAYREKNVKGTIQLPAGYTVGVMFDRTGVWMLGVEYEVANWSNYRFYGKQDQLGNASMFRIGGQWLPGGVSKKYINRITYRAGFNIGKDYLIVSGEQLPLYAGSIGFGLPIRRWNAYSNQFTQINTSFEMGKRGKNSQPLTENFFKFSIGLCLSDLWFNKRKFD